RASRGAKRWRCALAGTGSLLFALIFLFAGLNVWLKVPKEPAKLYTQIAGLTTAICYLIGFAPPRLVRNSWQITELHRFLVRIAGKTTVERATSSLDHLCIAATDAAGSIASAAACWDESGKVFRVRASSAASLLGEAFQLEHDRLRSAWENR